MISKERLSEWPIQKKLIYSNSISIALAFIPMIVLMFAYEYFAMRHAKLEDIRLQAEIVAESVSAAVAFHDREAAEETLSALRNSNDLIEVCLVSEDGNILSRVSRNGTMDPGTESNSVNSVTVEMGWDTVTVYRPLFLRNQHVGTLVLKNSLESFYQRLFLYGFIVLAVAVFGFMLSRWIAGRISRTITEPLADLIQTAQRISSDEKYDETIQIRSKDEVGELSKAFGDMMTQIRKRDKTMQQMAYYDHVTGVANRHYFEERIAQAVINAERCGTFCYLLMIDLDDFKTVNDRYGHHTGDALLRHVSQHILESLRNNDTIFRIGGDEFGIIIESQNELDSLGLLAEKIIRAVSVPMIREGEMINVGASIGINCFPVPATDARTLMSGADAAMYAAKYAGKNNYRIYSALLSS